MLKPAHVLANVIRKGENLISGRYAASISEELNCQKSVADASQEVDGKTGVDPDSKRSIMSDYALPRVVIFPWFIKIEFIFQIARDDVTVNSVVDGHHIGHNCHTDPVANDVKTGQHFLHTTVSVAHFNLKARMAVLSYIVDEDDQQ